MNPDKQNNIESESDSSNTEVKERLTKDFSVNMAAKAFYLVTRFFIPPLTMSHVSLEEYGIWAACFVLIGYLGMSAFGIINVYMRFIAEYYAKNEIDKIGRLLSTGVTVMFLVSLVLLSGLWVGLPSIVNHLKIPAQLHDMAVTLIFVTAAAFILDMCFGAFGFALAGIQRVTEQTLIGIFSYCLESILIVAFLFNGFGIYSLLYAFVIRYVVATACNIYFCFRALPQLSVGLRHFDRSMLRLFYGYGSVVQLSGILGMFQYSVEKLISGMYVGVAATGLIDVGEKLPTMACQVPASMNWLFVPVMSHMNSLDQGSEIGKLYIRGARYMNMLLGYGLGFLAAFALPMITVWLGDDAKYETAAIIMMIMCLPYQLNELTGTASAFHRGAGKPSRELFYPLTQLFLVFLLVAGGFWLFGKTVLAICVAIAISMTVSALLYLVYTNRYMKVNQREYFLKVILPGLVPYLIGFVCNILAAPIISWAGTGRWQVLPVLAVCGMVYLLMVALILYFVLCGWEERNDLQREFLKLFKRLVPMKRQPA